ncbi:MAG: dATP/dGTP diphosphohydrolase domain-containing protein [Clostridia bacterium]|nr:dATP/dGTP diphosphohydrolase domain-containing protein [Clostridia bacterium]
MEDNKSKKYDQGKLMWHLLPLSLIKPVVEIFQYGLEKYKKEGSWKELDNGYIRYRDAFFRHLEAHESGQLRDEESGFPHIQHCAWNALAMMYFALKEHKYGDK